MHMTLDHRLRYLAVIPLTILAFWGAGTLGIYIPNQPLALMVAVAFCAYRGGLAIGLLGAALHVAYTAVFFSMPGHLFTYDRDGLWRTIVVAFAAPGMATMVGLLRREADRAIAREKQNEAALLRLNAELEARVIERTAELAEARDLAEESNRVKSMFLANMSHELRTPLNAIIGFSEMLLLTGRRQPCDENRVREYIGDIHACGQHLLNLINGILDISRIQAGKLQLREELVAIGETVATCFMLTGQRAAGSGITLRREIPDDLPDLLADATRLKQILLNLVSNAVKFTPDNGIVTVAAARAEDGGLTITVTDTGIGMSEADIAVAMQPFEQVDSSLARRYEGTGLGLPLAKAFVELHGGTLTIVSAVGRGTAVRIAFPATRTLPLRAAVDTAAPIATRAGRG